LVDGAVAGPGIWSYSWIWRRADLAAVVFTLVVFASVVKVVARVRVGVALIASRVTRVGVVIGWGKAAGARGTERGPGRRGRRVDGALVSLVEGAGSPNELVLRGLTRSLLIYGAVLVVTVPLLVDLVGIAVP
jgi:hypothetical protein